MNPQNNGLDAAFLCTHCQGLNQAPESDRNTLMSCGHCEQPVAVPSSFIASGSILDEYIVKETLGRDASCDLIRAYHPALDRFVVLKVMVRCRDRAPSEDFVQAARLAARLNYPGIAGVQAVGIAGDCPWAAMEFVDGSTLKAYLDQNSSFAEADARFIGIHLAKALAHGVERDLIHGALMPSRVAISQAGDVKLFDLGMSREASAKNAGAALSEEDFYGPPEGLRGQPPSAAGDIYSLGAILYHCSTGRRLFAEEGARRGLEAAQLHKQAAFADEDSISDDFADLILSLLDKEPSLRPSAASVASSLRRLAPPKASKRPVTLHVFEVIDDPEPLPRSSQSLKVKISTTAALSNASGRNAPVKAAKKRSASTSSTVAVRSALRKKSRADQRQQNRKRHSASGRRKKRPFRPPPASSGNSVLIICMAALILILLIVVLAMAAK